MRTGSGWRYLAAIVALALLAAGCAGDDDGSDGAAPPATGGADGPPGDPPQTVTRDDVDGAIEQIPAEAEAILEATGVPGMAVTVVFDDEVVFAEGFGVKEAGSEEPIGADTVFQLASLSKSIGATVVAGLVGDEALAWEDPVVEYLPDFQLSDPAVTELVTVAEMFSHSSGLPDHAGDMLEDLGYDRDTIIERLALLPLVGFGDYEYTNFGLTTGAVAAATAAGTTWEDATDDVLFGPAGMDNTSARFEDYISAADRAVPHQRDEDGNFVAQAQRDPDPQSPAGGVSSTATDLGQWLRIQLNEGQLGDEQIVDPDALVQMQTPQVTSKALRTPSAHAGLYGLGLGVGVRDDGYTKWSHSGAFLLGTGTAVAMIPGQEVGVAVITNGAPVGAAEAMTEIVLDLIVDGEVSRDWLGLFNPIFENFYVPETPTDWSGEPQDPAEPAEPATYVGTYGNSYYGTLEVVQRDGDLVMILGPNGDEYPLEPYDGDAFLFTPPGENSLGPTGIDFTVDGDQATSVTSEYYDKYGLGAWLRGGDGAGPVEAATGELPAAALEVMESDDYASAQWSLQVVPLDGGDPVYEVAPGAISAMASNTKLYTVGTWLDVYGPEHTIETPVYGLGSVSDGALDGDLVLRAMGDLVMGSRNAGSGELGYSVPPQPDANGLPGAMPAPGDPLAGLDDLAEQVAVSGVTEVGGNVLIDDRLFEQWQTPRPLEVSPIVINDNLLAIVTSPGTEGQPGSIETRPDTEYFTIVNDTETVAAGEDTDIEVEPAVGAAGQPTNTLTVSGQIAADSEPLLNVYDVPDPASYARTLFIEALRRAGVTVTADPLAVNDVSGLPDAAEYEAGNEPVATLASPPIDEIAELIWKISHNLGADLSLCLLAVNAGSTDCEDGFAPIRERIGDLGIDQGAVWMFDGSGSIFASTTPAAMTTWIQWLHTLEWGDQLREMLPILGVDGSLSLAETDSPSTGMVQAKTGTWASVDPGTGRLLMLDQSLAGLIDGGDGEQYAFALYMNGTSFDDPSAILGVLGDIAAVAAALQQDL